MYALPLTSVPRLNTRLGLGLAYLIVGFEENSSKSQIILHVACMKEEPVIPKHVQVVKPKSHPQTGPKNSQG